MPSSRLRAPRLLPRGAVCQCLSQCALRRRRFGLVLGACLLISLLATGCAAAHATSPPSVYAAFAANPPAAWPKPPTWIDGLAGGQAGRALLVECLDADHDGDLDADDGGELQGADFRIPLQANACDEPGRHADFFATDAIDATVCDSDGPAALIVAVAGGGSDLTMARAGDSLGLLDIVNALQARLRVLGMPTEVILSTSAIFHADLPQTRMEQWLSLQVSRRLEALPCMRAVIVGHSHGGVTVSSVTAALDGRFSSRMFGVLLDRTDMLYDRSTDLMPGSASILNLYQLNEGWHGGPMDQRNVTNIDVSDAVAPSDPDVPGSPLARVTHPTMDYAPAVQSVVVDAAVEFLAGGR